MIILISTRYNEQQAIETKEKENVISADRI